jgi:hypothetical protein
VPEAAGVQRYAIALATSPVVRKRLSNDDGRAVSKNRRSRGELRGSPHGFHGVGVGEGDGDAAARTAVISVAYRVPFSV